MRVEEVKDSNTSKAFLDVARALYKDDTNWVCPLDIDINKVFDPEGNDFYKHAEACRWILLDDNNEMIGRIAAFYDKNTLSDGDQPTGGCGFFECINSQEAANLLFDTAKAWLQNKGVEAMDGPINFGEHDKWWGLLIDGFTQPAYEVPYNPKYYQQLFESYGFQVYYYQMGYHLDLSKEVPERFWKIAEWVAKKPGYEFKPFAFNKLEQMANDFVSVFNEAWKDFKKDFEPLKVEYVMDFIGKNKVVLEEDFIWIAYNNGKPIAIYLMIPDVNQIFKHFNGKLHILNKLRLLYMVKTKKITRAKGILMGVVPKFQKMGVESAIFWHLNKAMKENLTHYTEFEFNWVGDFNPPMRKLWESLGADEAKRYITYRYLFDRSKPFKRYPIPAE